jgi:hypothetical protein
MAVLAVLELAQLSQAQDCFMRVVVVVVLM